MFQRNPVKNRKLHISQTATILHLYKQTKNPVIKVSRSTFHMIPRHSCETVSVAASWNAGRRTLVTLLPSVAGLRLGAVSFCISRMMQWHRLLLLLSFPSDNVVVVGNSALAVVQARELHAIYSNHITLMLFITIMTSYVEWDIKLYSLTH